MVKCTIFIQVLQKNGSPAPFATLDVFKVYRFLWWEFDVWVGGATADFFGNITLWWTDKDWKYHFRFRWTDAYGRLLQKDVWITLTSCPYRMQVTMT